MSDKNHPSFDQRNKLAWTRRLARLFPMGVPRRAAWTEVRDIMQVLRHFCVPENLNHTLLPTGGGQDFCSAKLSSEPGCLEFVLGREFTYVCKPRVLEFEHFHDAPWESFFLLTCAPLTPTGLYPQTTWPSEDVMEMSDGSYVDEKYFWDDYWEDQDQERPAYLRKCRIVTRYFCGKFLLVAKRSLWNRSPQGYDGCHNTMNASEIYAAIERGQIPGESWRDEASPPCPSPNSHSTPPGQRRDGV